MFLGIHRRTGFEVAIKALDKKKIKAQKMTEKVHVCCAPLRPPRGASFHAYVKSAK